MYGTAEDLARPRWMQPALFAFEYALARLWMSWGAQPSALVGHSLGEVIAATISGVLTLADAPPRVAARARVMSAVDTPGGMVSIGAPADEVAPLLDGHPDLAVAAI